MLKFSAYMSGLFFKKPGEAGVSYFSPGLGYCPPQKPPPTPPPPHPGLGIIHCICIVVQLHSIYFYLFFIEYIRYLIT